MKKTFLFCLPLLFFSCSSSKKASEPYIPAIHFSGDLEEAEVQFLKDNYPWPAGNLLLINFRQPRSNCHFDNYVVNNDTRRWYRNFYNEVDLKSAANIFVFSEGERVTKHLDNKTYFDDKEDFLLNNYFHRKASCFAIMAINDEGEYLQFNGHYSERQVNAYIEVLK